MAFLLLLESPWAMPARPCGGLLPPLTFLPKASQRPRAARSTKGARSSPLVREGLELEDFDVEKARLVGLISSQSYALVAGSKTAAGRPRGAATRGRASQSLRWLKFIRQATLPFFARLTSRFRKAGSCGCFGEWVVCDHREQSSSPSRSDGAVGPVEFGRVGREGSPRPSTRGRSGSGRDAFPWRSPFA